MYSVLPASTVSSCTSTPLCSTVMRAGDTSPPPCEKRGALDLLWAFVAALVANQATFHISPQVAAK